MELHKIDLDETDCFSKTFIDYINQEPALSQFYNQPPTLEGFEKQIAGRSFPQEHRDILSEVLNDQYEGFELTPGVRENISKLSKSDTYTITTGHQLNIFTGPLYFIYKIVTVVRTCQELSARYKDRQFVPIYWMASEDHDFEEISHFRLNSERYEWRTQQSGAVGRFDPKELQEIIGKIPGLPQLFKTAYTQPSLSAAVRYYVNELFGQYGVVVLDADDARLKRLLQPVMKADIIHQATEQPVVQGSKKLDSLGYHTQVNSRKINFFYLKGDVRERIENNGKSYKVLNTDITFTEEEIITSINEHPEYFSPNVILRPVYQEMILPNLAYVGGPSELVYWLQLKSAFQTYKVSFPILLPRNFAMIIPQHIDRKLHKTGLTLEELFNERQAVFSKIARKHSDTDLALNGQMKGILQLFDEIKRKALLIDPTLGPHVEAQGIKTKDRLEKIEKKFVRAEKRKQADRLRQVEEVLNYLFPHDSLQERIDNFLNFYISDPHFIDKLVKQFDPFDYRFNLLIDG